ncbi:hypothetical protein BJ684DRAFT_18137, partial [Piptocephalis cylindrospora]
TLNNKALEEARSPSPSILLGPQNPVGKEDRLRVFQRLDRALIGLGVIRRTEEFTQKYDAFHERLTWVLAYFESRFDSFSKSSSYTEDKLNALVEHFEQERAIIVALIPSMQRPPSRVAYNIYLLIDECFTYYTAAPYLDGLKGKVQKLSENFQRCTRDFYASEDSLSQKPIYVVLENLSQKTHGDWWGRRMGIRTQCPVWWERTEKGGKMSVATRERDGGTRGERQEREPREREGRKENIRLSLPLNSAIPPTPTLLSLLSDPVPSHCVSPEDDVGGQTPHSGSIVPELG